jgi:hypothetical protein
VRSEQSEELLEHQILGALLQASSGTQDLVGSATELAIICSKQRVSCTENDVSRALRQYGFETKSVRLDGDPRKRYVLTREALSELSSRYLGSSVAVGAPVESTGATTC